jgi:ABC-2 type transport system permease protein
VLGAVIDLMSTWTHFGSMSRGVIDSRDVIYFLSLMVLGLSLAEVNLAKRLIRGS